MEFEQVFERIFTFEAIVATAVFVLVCLGVLLALALSRKKSGDTRKKDTHPLVEGAYAVLLGGVAALIVVITASAHEEVRTGTTGYQVAAQANATEVDVTAYQWCWEFFYADTGKSVTGECRAGPGQQKSLPTLVVPTGKPVELRLSSNDVIHSFWIPDLAVKMDAFPDHTNTVTLRFDEPGRWLGRCAEFCGSHHTGMHFYVRAVPPEQFEQFQQQGTLA